MENDGRDDVSEERIKKMSKDVLAHVTKSAIEEQLKKSNNKLLFLSLAVFIVSFSSLIATYFQSDSKFIAKEQLKNNIKSVLLKNGSIEDARTIFDYEIRNNIVHFINPFKEKSYYVKKNLNLNIVFDDVKAELFQGDNIFSDKEKLILNHINLLKEDYNKINPFNGLDEVNKRNFEIIHRSLDSHQYEKIDKEINLVISSIKEKNNSIEKYLSSSDTSLYLTIASMAFSIFVFFWPRIQRIFKMNSEKIEQSTN